MTLPNLLAMAMAVVVAYLLVRVPAARRHRWAQDMPTRLRLFRIGWEIRAFTFVVAGPIAAGMLMGRLPSDYAVALISSC